MKEKIMKLSVLVGIHVLALFIMVGMASADPRYSIQGVYAVTGFSSCDGAPSIVEADYIFRHDGTGSISNGVIRSLSGPVLTMTAEFEYTVTKEGRIELKYPEAGLELSVEGGPYLMTWNGGPSHGVISPDRKTITISCGPPVFLTLIDSEFPALPAPPVGTTAYCIISLSGVRIR
jgi:hypothetical protein